MFGTLDGKLTGCVVLDHLGYADERLAELSQDVPPVQIGHNFQVHKAFVAPTKNASTISKRR